MSHFTYSEDVDNGVLKQGDILDKNELINEMITYVHPHYLKEDYKYFIVLTQSCDLVKRVGGKCKAQYISLAAVRPLTTLIQREISKYQKTTIEQKGKLCSNSKKQLLHMFLDRLFNNNEQEYFYLHEDVSFGFSEPMVAFLRLSIAIKSEIHYEKCLDSKIMELTDNFTAKLGWLVGQMYSRIGTLDWVPTLIDDNGFKKKCNEVLDQHAHWFDDRVIKEIQKHEEQALELSVEDIRRIAANQGIPKKKDIALRRINEILLNIEGINGREVDKLILKLNNDPVFSLQFPK